MIKNKKWKIKMRIEVVVKDKGPFLKYWYANEAKIIAQKMKKDVTWKINKKKITQIKNLY